MWSTRYPLPRENDEPPGIAALAHPASYRDGVNSLSEREKGQDCAQQLQERTSATSAPKGGQVRLRSRVWWQCLTARRCSVNISSTGRPPRRWIGWTLEAPELHW